MPTNNTTTSVELTEQEAALIYLLRATEQGQENALDNEALRPYYDRFVKKAFANLSQTMTYVYHAAKLDALRTATHELDRAFNSPQ